MNDYESWEIAGHTLEYVDDTHVYICDGVIVPSITQIMRIRFGDKYAGVSEYTLRNASERGTAIHKAIEDYCRTGTEADLPEVRNFKFLQKHYEFTVLENEKPVILFKDDVPICAGRLDMVISNGSENGLADIKCVSALDKDYLAYQLNLYRIAYQQSYGTAIDYLRGIHLRENVRKFVTIPINEDMAWQLIDEYLKGVQK